MGRPEGDVREDCHEEIDQGLDKEDLIYHLVNSPASYLSALFTH